MEIMVLAAFAAALFICVALDIPVLVALGIGFCLFFGYGLYKKHTVGQMWKFALSGMKTVKNILITFLLIGVITALWRACGTIPYIVYYATAVCSPQIMVLLTFLLCCLISFLTGTSFGTAATMGVICVTMANSMGIPILFSGGAVLSGALFGDRCSPMSTSALLVSTLTKTNLYKNIKNMAKTAVFPFLLTVAVYFIVGLFIQPQGNQTDVREIFATHFNLHPAMLLPAVVIVVLSLCKVKVKIAMSVSIAVSTIVALTVQKMEITPLLKAAVLGFSPADGDLAALLSGGGMKSMINALLIVCISASFSGMFDGTHLLDELQEKITVLAKKTTPYTAVCLTSVLTSIIASNQTLAIMLTHQLSVSAEPDNEKMALHLEDTAVVISPLVPWSIAGAVPLASVGAPNLCMLTAFYLYLLPLCRLTKELINKKGSSRKVVG
ncbi:MAG: sodium:proton antiporter [Ruminococcaceae bacterium]|nr:sodium:proton antiporter [Oscillospiraceae bacterium]